MVFSGKSKPVPSVSKKKSKIKTNKHAVTAFKHAILKLPYAFKGVPWKENQCHQGTYSFFSKQDKISQPTEMQLHIDSI